MTGIIMLRLLLLTAASFTLLEVVGAELRDLKVQCSRNGMTVHVKFDTPFYGIIYSQDFYQVDKCTYVTSADSVAGRNSFSFSIPQKGCGTTTSNSQSPRSSRKLSNPFQRALDVRHPVQQQQTATSSDDVFLENTIIVQHDPDFQEAGDLARRLRCVWRNSLQKSVNAKMPEVYQPSLITVKYDYRSVNHLVDVQLSRSSGPLLQPVRGFISSQPNSPSSLVIYMKDGTKTQDANVLGCSYFNARTGETLKLTDDQGCSIRPDLTTAFYKMKETTNPNSDLTLYTYFRGFRVPRDGYFGINCVVEVCNGRCGERCRNLRLAA